MYTLNNEKNAFVLSNIERMPTVFSPDIMRPTFPVYHLQWSMVNHGPCDLGVHASLC